MLFKTIQLIQIATYIIIASQLIFYLMVMIDALKKVTLANFLEQRQAVDAIFGKRYQPIYYTALLCALIMTATKIYQQDRYGIVLQSIALLCLIVDITIALTRNAPINKMVNAYVPGDRSIDWETIRIQWLHFIGIRGIFISIGMLALVVALLL